MAEDLDRPDPDAERLDLADQQRGEERARDAAHAADDDDDERVRDRAEVEEELRRLARNLQRAAEAGEQRPEREHAGEEPFLVHAERADHLAVLGGRPDQRAPAGAVEEEPERAEHERPDRDQEEVVLRERDAEDVDRAAEARRPRPEQVLGAPDPEREVLDDEREREGREQLEELGRVVDPPQDRDLDQRPDRADDERRGDHAAPEPGRAGVEPCDDAVGDVDAQHVQRTVGEVHDPRHAEDQREPDGDQEQRRRARQAVQELDEDRRHASETAAGARTRPRLIRAPALVYSGRIFLISASAGRNLAPSR